MKTQDVIDLAVASGMYQDGDMFFSPATGDADVHISDLEYFAKTVEERTLSKQKAKWYQEGYEAGQRDEREACAKDCCDAVEVAKRNERYVKEMEQPTPKQSGTFSITVSKVCDADALPPTASAVYWMDMVVANLVRNGVDKHRARELAYHFYTYTTPLENSNG